MLQQAVEGCSYAAVMLSSVREVHRSKLPMAVINTEGTVQYTLGPAKVAALLAEQEAAMGSVRTE